MNDGIKKVVLVAICLIVVVWIASNTRHYSVVERVFRNIDCSDRVGIYSSYTGKTLYYDVDVVSNIVGLMKELKYNDKCVEDESSSNQSGGWERDLTVSFYKGGTPTGYILSVRPNGGSIRYLIHSDSVDMISVSDNSEIYEYLLDLLSN